MADRRNAARRQKTARVEPATTAAVAATTRPARHRLDPADRRLIIAREAAAFFAEQGFEGQTRELAARLCITQPLLYRYFPSKDALIDRVYQDVFIDRWNPEWEKLVSDRRRPLQDRLIAFYKEYAKVIITYEWVRLFMFAGLRNLDLNARYLDFLQERLFDHVVGALRREFGRPTIKKVPVTRMEIEMIWGLHARIFYLGVRRFIYNMPLDGDVDGIIEASVMNFMGGIGGNLP